MDLPTYTSIWRIEKRLYKLYDFRLPMPLPIGQITVFAAIAVPYVVLLEVLGLPFNHTLIWLYILPPGALTWLATRPVLEGKRLSELIRSQVRYLAEPRIWCRMAPWTERGVVVVTARVWRPRASDSRRAKATPPQAPARPGAAPAIGQSRSVLTDRVGQPPRRQSAPPPAPRHVGRRPLPPRRQPAARGTSRPESAAGQAAAFALVGTGSVGTGSVGTELRESESGGSTVASAVTGSESAAREVSASGVTAAALAGSATETAGATPAGVGSAPSRRPAVTVVGPAPGQVRPPAVERALAGPSARRGEVRAGRVTVVPGGHRPGRPDQLAKDRARAMAPIGDSGRIVVLGCTAGAGQTVTALLTGEVLASLRSDRVAVLDLNPGPGSLEDRAKNRPALSQAASLGSSRLVVLGPPLAPGASAGDGLHTTGSWPTLETNTFELAALQHDLVLVDPSTAAVPRLLEVANQLVLVAPASAAAANSIAMTFEWLDAHAQTGLGAGAIMVLNGVSRRSISHVEQAERVCAGRCRAVVRVPWDDQLNGQDAQRTHPPAPGSSERQRWSGLLGPGTAGAYTALAGVLVSSVAERHAPDQPAGFQRSHARQGSR